MRCCADVRISPRIYYTWLHGHAVLADEFGAGDHFGLAPGVIVDRIVAAGYTPWIEAPQPDFLPTLGVRAEVEREGLFYIVSVSRDAEEIDVQEVRAEAYDPLE